MYNVHQCTNPSKREADSHAHSSISSMALNSRSVGIPTPFTWFIFSLFLASTRSGMERRRAVPLSSSPLVTVLVLFRLRDGGIDDSERRGSKRG